MKEPTKDEIERVDAWQEQQRIKIRREVALSYYHDVKYECLWMGSPVDEEYSVKELIGILKYVYNQHNEDRFGGI